MKTFEQFVNESIDYKDLWVEFGYFNQYLSKQLNKNEFEKLVKSSKTVKIPYIKISDVYQRYNEDFKKLQTVKDDEKIKWWLPKYLKMKKFEPEKQTSKYYYKLVKAIKDGKVNEPIFILSINDGNNKNYRFICGGRNRATLSYILKKDVNSTILNIPEIEKEENIQKIIDNLNK